VLRAVAREQSDQDWTLSLRLQVHEDTQTACRGYAVTIIGEQWLEEARALSDPLILGTMDVTHFPRRPRRGDAGDAGSAAGVKPIWAILNHEAGTVAQLVLDAADIWFLDRIELRPELRGQGLGARALDLFVEVIANSGVLVLTPLNEGVGRYWRSLGFEPTTQDGTALYKALA
jgi:hypothetical protein